MSDPLAGKYELYRIVTDYDALREGFADRIEDLNTPMSEIDTAAELTPGHVQKLLCKSDADWARSFTWKTLGPMLKGTGLALVLVVDDERFAPVKATLAKRRRKNSRAIARRIIPAWLFSRDKAREMGRKRWANITGAERSRMMKKVRKAAWMARRRKARE
jgi:hypothetical protein